MSKICKHCEEKVYLSGFGFSHVNNGKGAWYHNHNRNGCCDYDDIGNSNIAEPIEEIKYTNNDFMELLRVL